MNSRELPCDIDAGNKCEAKGNSGEEEGGKKSEVVAELHKPVKGVVQLPARLLHVKLHRDEVEDDQHHAEDRHCKTSLEADSVHRFDVILFHKLLLVGELAGVEGHGNYDEDVA